MAKPEKYSWLDEFLESVEKSLGFMDLSTLQPTSWRHFQPLIAKEWLTWFSQITIAAQNFSSGDLAKVLEPDLCREHLWFTLEDLKSARWPRQRRLEHADFFYRILKAQMPYGDLFGLFGTTKKHSRNEIREITQRSFQKGTPTAARELGKIYNGAYNLGAALYLDFYMGIAIENHGPYVLPGNKILVIKEMRNLKPREIWPRITTKADTIVMYAVYQNILFSTDLVSCHTQYKGDIIGNLKAWRVEIDGKVISDLSTLSAVSKNLATVGSAQWKRILDLPESQLLQKAIWIRCFCFKKICQLLRLDWRPTQALLRAARGKQLSDGWKSWRQPKTQKKILRYWRYILDPRKDFYPRSLLKP